MNKQVKKLVEKLERLSSEKQEEMVNLVLDELNWDITFEQTQEQLALLAREAKQDYDAGNTSDKDW